jgi:hypothetical protein
VEEDSSNFQNLTNPATPVCEVTYDWQIRAEKPLLRWLTPVLRPLFSFNHEWAMRKGEESLKLELQRRRAPTENEKTKIALPPPPTFPHNLLNNKIL